MTSTTQRILDATSELYLEGSSSKVTMEVVHGGHILFDEVPEVANGSMLKWLSEL